MTSFKALHAINKATILTHEQLLSNVCLFGKLNGDMMHCDGQLISNNIRKLNFEAVGQSGNTEPCHREKALQTAMQFRHHYDCLHHSSPVALLLPSSHNVDES